MAYNTVIQQGYFTSNGLDKIIELRSDADWVEVYNLTNMAGATQWAGLEWYWQRGMTNDDSLVKYHPAANQTLAQSTSVIGFNGATYRGVSLIDTSSSLLGAPVAITAGTNATAPVYSTANTGILQNGSVVRIQNTDHTSLNGLDFTITNVVANTSFDLDNTLATAPGVIAGANGTYRFVAHNSIIYNKILPSRRVISNITAANPGVVTTLVDHGYFTGQKVRISVPEGCGMTELNGQICTITVLTVSTFSIGIDTSGYAAFTFPLPATVPFTPAEVMVLGGELAEQNTTFKGIILGTSTAAAVALGSPGGTAGDAIKWRAGKSFAYDID